MQIHSALILKDLLSSALLPAASWRCWWLTRNMIRRSAAWCLFNVSSRIEKLVPSNEYHFITHWRVAGTVEEVYDIRSNAKDLARWWPAMCLDVQVLSPSEKNGVGIIVSLYIKG